MTRAGSVLHSITERAHVISSGPCADAALIRARMVYGAPVEITTVITETALPARLEVWSDLTHAEALRWLLRRLQEQGTMTGAIVTGKVVQSPSSVPTTLFVERSG